MKIKIAISIMIGFLCLVFSDVLKYYPGGGIGFWNWIGMLFEVVLYSILSYFILFVRD